MKIARRASSMSMSTSLAAMDAMIAALAARVPKYVHRSDALEAMKARMLIRDEHFER